MKRPERRQFDAGENSNGRGRRTGRVSLMAIVAASACALLASAAQASTVTVGSVLPPGSTPQKFESVQTFFNTALPEKGASLASPVNGAVVRWRAQGLSGGPFYLRVLRPNGSGAYMAVGTSGAATPSGTGLQTFSANIPVRSGDLIGVDPTNATDEIGVSEVAGANFGFIFPPPAEGATLAPSGGSSGKEIQLSAEIQPAPAITSIAPNAGSIAGGTQVTITGTNLNAASAVKFGSLPATSFTAESETQITATAPPSAVAGKVAITATTLAGTSPAVADFTYKACIVPKLKDKKLKQAKRALWNAGCKLGTVKGPKKSSAAKVTKQSPKPRQTRVPGTKVNITLAE